MEFIPQEIPEVILIKPQIFGDNRGFFMEAYNKKHFFENGVKIDFIQDNLSRSTKNTLRGVHYQLPPFAQDKLVSVMSGAVLDVAVDIRYGSPTFGKYVTAELTDENKHMFLVPKGFAHGFIALSDTVDFFYKVSNYYSPEHDRGIIWNDSDINIQWGTETPILSEKDTKHKKLSEVEATDLFKYSNK